MSTSTHPYRLDVPNSTAPTPGHSGGSDETCTTGSTKPQRTLGSSGSQGCLHSVAQTTGGVFRSRANGRPNSHLGATSGRLGEISGTKEARVKYVSHPQAEVSSPTKIDRSTCPGREGAHHPNRIGTANAYSTYGCRCPDARRARRRTDIKYRLTPHTTTPTTTTRQLQALACLGYSITKIAAGCCANPTLQDIRDGKTTRITQRIAQHVNNYYRTHSDHPLPHTRQTNQVRNHATRHGWAPPIAWDEDNISDPDATPQHNAADTGLPSDTEDNIELALMLSGQLRAQLAASDRRRIQKRAVTVLTSRGLSAPDIALRLDISARHVQRIRAEIAQDAASEVPAA